MLKRIVIIALLFGAFLYGVTHLFLLRFQIGDVYPPYSTLRTDPLGAKAIAESLDELPHLKVERNYRPITKRDAAEPITLVYAGAPDEAFWEDAELFHVERLAAAGSRIVITFSPIERSELAEKAQREKERKKKRAEERKKKRGEKTEEKQKKESGKDTKKPEEPEQPLTFFSFKEVADRWGFQFQYFPRRDRNAEPRRARQTTVVAGLEPDLPWYTALHFGKVNDTWRTLYTVDKSPVLIERPFGSGSIVLASDSYFISNEALRNEPSPKLLAWLIGSPRTIVFDEESHGVRENPGIATLARRYGLHGVVAGLLLIAALFIWQSTSRLVPPVEELDPDAGVVQGREASEGLLNLLRRTIPPAQLLGICAEEWKKAFDPEGRSLKSAHLDQVLAAENAKPPRARQPVQACQTITEVLSQKK